MNSSDSEQARNHFCTTVQGHRAAHDADDCVTDRQERITNFEQDKLSQASIIGIGGAGGIGSEYGYGFARKGVGRYKILDNDVIERSNLSRQFYFEEQIYQYKAETLARNLAKHSTCGTQFEACNLSFEQAQQAEFFDLNDVDVAVASVDSSASRIAVAKHYLKTNIPVVFCALDGAGEACYVAVQEPGKACFGCILPHGLTDEKIPCVSPSVLDTAKMVAGLVLFTVDSLLMNRKRFWNYMELHNAGVMNSFSKTVERNPNCPICGL